jgi:hypothetical protein
MFLQWCRDELHLSFIFVQRLVSWTGRGFEKAPLQKHKRCDQEIDWDTVNRLSAENSDFSSFLNELTEDITLKKVKSKYDNILSPDEIEKYIKDKGIED